MAYTTESVPRRRPANVETTADVLVVGGGVGGVAAACSAARAGRTVVLTEESPWLGGQLTTQAVPPDEHRWIERSGSTGTYRAFRRGVRAYYRSWYPLSDEARRRRHLDPGNSWVSPLAHEPRVALVILDGLLAPYRASARLRVLLEHSPVGAVTHRDRVEQVAFEDLRTGDQVVVRGGIVIDATETGELLELAEVERVTGAESQAATGEPHAPTLADPLDMQASTWCLVMDHVEGEDHTIARPDGYERWRSRSGPAWPDPQLGWAAVDPRTLERIVYPFDPRARALVDRSHLKGQRPGAKDLWTYRRILARDNLVDGAIPGDVSVLNWPQNDYVDGPLFGEGSDAAARHLAGARSLSLSLLYWLQTEAPRADGGAGWPGLRPRGDLVGTQDGLALRPYIRESRRIRAETTVSEQDVSIAARGSLGARRYADSVGTGYYRLDLHPSTGGSTFLDIPSYPYELPLGALLPVRVDNLLPGAKDIGTTHIANGCYRMHPTEWLVGEVAGALAAYALEVGEPPRAVRADARHLERLQARLVAAGVDLHWPDAIVEAFRP